MTELRELAGAGQACRAGADDRDFLPRGFPGLKQIDTSAVHVVHGVTLQPADRNRLPLAAKNTSALAQFLYRANARASCAEQVGFENSSCRASQIPRCDFLDESRDVDVGRARMGTRRVKAHQAAGCFDRCFMRCKRRQKLLQSAAVVAR